MKKAVKNATAVAIPNVDNMPSKVKVYTRTGDAGKTSLYGGKRVPKSYLRVEVYGTIDELNSYIGLACEYLSENLTEDLSLCIEEDLRTIQRTLMDIMSYIATPREESSNLNFKQRRTELDENIVLELEDRIDNIDSQLPPLRNFILPSGGKGATHLHVCRSIARRAERRVVALNSDRIVIQYLNRLSDYFFVCARLISTGEIIYQKS